MVKAKCKKCGYEWETKSKMLSVSCSSCGSKVKIRDIVCVDCGRSSQEIDKDKDRYDMGVCKDDKIRCCVCANMDKPIDKEHSERIRKLRSKIKNKKQFPDKELLGLD